MKLFAGRMNRTTYLLVVLAVTLATLVFSIPRVEHALETNELLATVVIFGVALPLVIWQFATATRRLHDCNMSGWLSLLLIVPGMQLFLLLMPGTKGENKHGPSPTELYDLKALVVDKNSLSRPN